MDGWSYKEAKPGHRPWHKRIGWSWNRTKEAAPIASNVLYDYNRRPLWGHYDDSNNVFGPYERPILDATGGGQLYSRQLPPFHPNMVFNQQGVNVSITGDGSELTGSYTVLPLVNAQTQQSSSEVVSVSTQNGVTNIQLGNTPNG